MNDEIIDQNMVKSNNEAITITNDKAVYRFQNTSANELASKIESYLTGKGYKIEEGNSNNGVYGKGNKTLRILFGAFVKRFTWRVTVKDEGNETILTFLKAEKGYWGGAIGVAQVKNEFRRITESLRQFHDSFRKNME